MSDHKALVFISCPYSKPSPSANVHRSAREYDWVWQSFEDRVIPVSMVVSSNMQDMIIPREYDQWLDLCLAMLRRCDLLYVLPGESSGVEKEIALAKSLGIPIVHSRGELEAYLDEHPEIYDNRIAQIRKEIGSQLYDAKRRGVDFAQEGLSEAGRVVSQALRSGFGALTRKVAQTSKDKNES